MIAECFRRDEIDASHYPVFHQMEVVRAFRDSELEKLEKEQQIALAMKDLQ